MNQVTLAYPRSRTYLSTYFRYHCQLVWTQVKDSVRHLLVFRLQASIPVSEAAVAAGPLHQLPHSDCPLEVQLTDAEVFLSSTYELPTQ